MKKLFIVLFVSSFLSGFSQEKDSTDFKRNELKGNALLLVLGSLEASYERILSKESGVGISVSVPIDKYNWDINFAATAYYRYYFGKKTAAGFFGEAFGMLNNVDDYVYKDATTYYSYVPERITDFALGIGLGGKWITNKGLLLEVNAGVGRNLFNNRYDRDFELIGRGGITIGYRF